MIVKKAVPFRAASFLCEIVDSARAGNRHHNERPTAIPFCRKREALNRECRKNHKGRESPAREVVQNGTWNSPGNCPGGRVAFSLWGALAREPALSTQRALASPGFRLAASGWAVSLMRGYRKCLSFSEKRGGQTEWRWGYRYGLPLRESRFSLSPALTKLSPPFRLALLKQMLSRK